MPEFQKRARSAASDVSDGLELFPAEIIGALSSWLATAQTSVDECAALGSLSREFALKAAQVATQIKVNVNKFERKRGGKLTSS